MNGKVRKDKEHEEISWFPSQIESTPFPFQPERDFTICYDLYTTDTITKNNLLWFTKLIWEQSSQTQLSCFQQSWTARCLQNTQSYFSTILKIRYGLQQWIECKVCSIMITQSDISICLIFSSNENNSQHKDIRLLKNFLFWMIWKYAEKSWMKI